MSLLSKFVSRPVAIKIHTRLNDTKLRSILNQFNAFYHEQLAISTKV